MTPHDQPEDITRLIAQWQHGDSASENIVFEALYRHLHRIAVNCMRGEKPGQSIGPTALLHDAYVRFRKSQPIEVSNRGHFLALIARVMRHILVDRAKRRLAPKHGGGAIHRELDENLVGSDAEALQILIFQESLELLAKESEIHARVAEMIKCAGYTIDETAAILGLSSRTIKRKWQQAQVRLDEIGDGRKGPRNEHGPSDDE